MRIKLKWDEAFDSTDKQGGFIGSMFIGGNNVAVDLVREGSVPVPLYTRKNRDADTDSLATVHSFSADGLSFGQELTAAEESAKAAKKNVSHRYH